MTSELGAAKEHFVQGVSRVTNFWGFPKAMGAIYGIIYLSPQPLSLDEICEQAGVSKGAVSTNIRNLERLGVVHKKIRLGDRKDYYIAETDFWKILKQILREREKNEFNLAIRSVGESLEMVQELESTGGGDQMSAFYRERLLALKQFFDSLDSLVATIIALDDLRSSVVGKLFNGLSTQDTK